MINMGTQNRRFMQLVRALRGTPEWVAARELLHALRCERAFRVRIERLRRDQSSRLLDAARHRDALIARQRCESGAASGVVYDHGRRS